MVFCVFTRGYLSFFHHLPIIIMIIIPSFISSLSSFLPEGICCKGALHPGSTAASGPHRLCAGAQQDPRGQGAGQLGHRLTVEMPRIGEENLKESSILGGKKRGFMIDVPLKKSPKKIEQGTSCLKKAHFFGGH